MNKDMIIFFLMLLIFLVGSFYHIRIYKKCVYPVSLTRPMILVLTIASLLFIAMAHYVGEKSWYKYIIGLAASSYLISGALGHGISQEGIYYYPAGTTGHITRLAKWKDIRDLRLDLKKNQLKSFKIRTRTVFPGQTYRTEDMKEINKYIKINIKN